MTKVIFQARRGEDSYSTHTVSKFVRQEWRGGGSSPLTPGNVRRDTVVMTGSSHICESLPSPSELVGMEHSLLRWGPPKNVSLQGTSLPDGMPVRLSWWSGRKKRSSLYSWEFLSLFMAWAGVKEQQPCLSAYQCRKSYIAWAGALVET